MKKKKKRCFFFCTFFFLAAALYSNLGAVERISISSSLQTGRSCPSLFLRFTLFGFFLFVCHCGVKCCCCCLSLLLGECLLKVNVMLPHVLC
jgi:hypothetical protein